MTEDELYEARRVARLIAGDITQTNSEMDTHDLEEWMLENDTNMILFEKLTDPDNIGWAMNWFKSLELEEDFAKVQRKIALQQMPARTQPFSMRKMTRWLAAASVLVAVSVWWWRSPGRQSRPLAPAITQSQTLPRPGGPKAFLQVGEGPQINLGDPATATIAVGGAQLRNQHQVLTYPNTGGDSLVMNTLNVPAGGQYQLVLADGTHVWLNASSTLKFPMVFTGKTRPVTLDGQAYFEVAHNPGKPFIVQNHGIDVAVRGTHFEVRGYANDDAQRISLLEGAVQVRSGSAAKLLRPGEQAIVLNHHMTVQRNDHIADVVAWTRGEFSFDKSSMKDVMREIARWYNVKVIYEGNISGTITGQINRNSSILQTIHMLELSTEASIRLQGDSIFLRSR